jgi:hypothetical protein
MPETLDIMACMLRIVSLLTATWEADEIVNAQMRARVVDRRLHQLGSLTAPVGSAPLAEHPLQCDGGLVRGSRKQRVVDELGSAPQIAAIEPLPGLFEPLIDLPPLQPN